MSDPALNKSAENEDLSWDQQMQKAPERPHFVTNLVDSELIERPKRVIIAFVFVVIALIILVVSNVLAINNFEGFRDSLIGALPEEITDEYGEEDQILAVNVLLGTVAGLLLLMALVLAMTSATVMIHRSKAARIMFVVFGVVYLPVAFVAMVIREGGNQDMLLSALTVVFLFLAAVLFFTPRSSRWLTQKDDTRPIPIAQSRGISDEYQN